MADQHPAFEQTGDVCLHLSEGAGEASSQMFRFDARDEGPVIFYTDSGGWENVGVVELLAMVVDEADTSEEVVIVRRRADADHLAVEGDVFAWTVRGMEATVDLIRLVVSMW